MKYLQQGKCFNKTWGKTMTEVALSFKVEDGVSLKNWGKTESKCLTEKWIQSNSQQWRIKLPNP